MLDGLSPTFIAAGIDTLPIGVQASEQPTTPWCGVLPARPRRELRARPCCSWTAHRRPPCVPTLPRPPIRPFRSQDRDVCADPGADESAGAGRPVGGTVHAAAQYAGVLHEGPEGGEVETALRPTHEAQVWR
jgi:hypothetical protein